MKQKLKQLREFFSENPNMFYSGNGFNVNPDSFIQMRKSYKSNKKN